MSYTSMHKVMADLGYDTGHDGKKINAATSAQVKKFQKDRGLDPSGILTDEVANLMIDEYNKKVTENAQP